MEITNKHREYWSKNLNLTGVLLAIWSNVTWRENEDWTWSPEHKLEIVKNGLLQAANALGNVIVRAAHADQSQRQIWDRNGMIRTQHSGWRAELTPAAEAGDGTVPALSGAAPQSKSICIAAMTDFDHQGSYEKYCGAGICFAQHR